MKAQYSDARPKIL